MTAIAAGGYYSLAVTSSGTVFAGATTRTASSVTAVRRTAMCR